MNHIVLSIIALLTICCQVQAGQPNIVFLFSDDHAEQAIGAYGSKINKTPNIDRIAKEGAIFRNYFRTNSICGPSRACVLTGKHSHINGFKTNHSRFDRTQETFPKLLQKAGYTTAIFGKWHLGADPTSFDEWMWIGKIKAHSWSKARYWMVRRKGVDDCAPAWAGRRWA